MEKTAGDDPVEVGQIRVDVESKTVHGHPATYFLPDSGDLIALDPDTGESLFTGSFNSKLPKGEDDHIFEASQIPVKVEEVIVQVDNGISDDLSRTVIGNISSPVN